MLPTFDEYQRNGGASGWDGWDNYIGSHERDDWLVVTGRNRDSDILTNSNFDAALEMLGGESEDVEVHNFGHWACGWFELIMVRPGPRIAVATALDIRKQLDDYPVLDEEDFSNREWEDYWENWDDWGRSEFAREIVKAFCLPEEAEDEFDSEKLDEYFREDCGSDSEYMSSDIDRAVRGMLEQDLSELLGKNLAELKQVAIIEACKQGLDPFHESLRWRWDNQVLFPLEDWI